MIKAIIFDLDGTLIQTEILKAKSYAMAINALTKGEVEVKRVMEGFGRYVGLSRHEVANGLVLEFETALSFYHKSKSTEQVQQMVLSERLSIYQSILNDSQLLSAHFCPYNLGLLNSLFNDNYLTALATMSNLPEVERVLEIMNIRQQFHLVVTRENVKNGKPDPEIYSKTKDSLKIKAEECLVIEDSVNGIKAGLNAGMHVFAVTNDITRASVHDSGLLPDEFIIDDLTELKASVYQFLTKYKNQ
ncbi:MAG: HAD family phosphatase [Lentimicrobium sp.]|nr:HAD family phosphatase [Lentimicrobium sp.]